MANQIKGQSQLQQLYDFNKVMVQEMDKRGIDKTDYWKMVLDCETEKYAVEY